MRNWLCIIGILALFPERGAWPDCERYYRFIQEPAANAIVLAIDCSGSMNGQAFADAKAGALRFVEQMRPADQAAVIAFESDVEIVQEFTSDRERLKQAIGRLRVGGNTKLYDAIAQGILKLINREGGRIVVFLTDGHDTGSRYSVEEVRKIGISEGLFVYGIGFGNVNHQALNQLSSATGGSLERAENSGDFRDLYPRILAEYYRRYGDKRSQTGGLSIRSLPDSQQVIVNGAKEGMTPVKLDALPPGTYQIQVLFGNGTWQCGVPVKMGQRTVVDARESDLGGELVIASLPPNASVFLDGAYVGVTSMHNLAVAAGDSGWAEAAVGDANQLHILRVPYGVHRLKLHAMGDFDWGPEQEFEAEIQVTDAKTALYAEIMSTPRSPYILDSSGRARIIAKTVDPFDF